MLEKIKLAIENEISWHFHYLPPDCHVAEGDSHRIVVEISGSELEIYSFDEKPMAQLEVIENLFYGRT